MKNIGLIPPSNAFLKNQFFNLESHLNRDNCLYPFYTLKNELEKFNYQLNTVDLINNYTQLDLLIVYRIDINIKLLLSIIKKKPAIQIIYIMTEPIVVSPAHEFNVLKSKIFDKVLTWNDDYLASAKFVKYFYPNPLRSYTGGAFESKNGFLCMINSNKESSHKYELYTERRNAIKYFSKNNCLDLYGIGWSNAPCKYIKDAYKGVVKNKIKSFSEYKFAICYENSKCERGYITEKIFDCFSAGCIPIYLGAPNIDKYIPSDCYIDFRDFKDYSELFDFLKDMNKEVYERKQNSIKNFMKSKEYKEFTSSRFVQIVINCISTLEDVRSKHNYITDGFDCFGRLSISYFNNSINKIIK